MRWYTHLSLNAVFASLILVASVFVHDISTECKSRTMPFIRHAGYIGPSYPMGNAAENRARLLVTGLWEFAIAVYRTCFLRPAWNDCMSFTNSRDVSKFPCRLELVYRATLYFHGHPFDLPGNEIDEATPIGRHIFYDVTGSKGTTIKINRKQLPDHLILRSFDAIIKFFPLPYLAFVRIPGTMAIAPLDSHKPKDRPEPRGVVITPETADDPETHHHLNDKTHVAWDSPVTSLSKSSNTNTPSFLSTLRTLFTTLPSLPLSSPIWTLIEHLYRLPNPPPPRIRDPSRPMLIICVGFPRTGTESLAQSLSHLGYSHVYHGWDVVYDPSDLCYSPGWAKLARKKFYPVADNHSFQFQSQPTITRADFEELLGHCQAVTDAPASVFAAELIAAYPEAKVLLNMRRDEEKWQESLVKTIIKANESWGFWIASWLDRECFWAWHVYERFLWPALFRCVGGYGELGAVVRGGGGRWVWREHCNMIRGLVPPSRLLEWYIEDGWEPLCKFLDKEIPDIPFPHANAAVGGWKAREEQCNKRWVDRAFINLVLIFILLVFLIVAWWWF